MFTIDTYIQNTTNKGLGVFSKEHITKDTIIWESIEGLDIKIHKTIIDSLNAIQKKSIDRYFWREGDYYFSSCDHSMFINHDKYPNIITSGSKYLIASKDISPNEEITIDYGSFDDDYDSYKNNLI